MKQHRATAAFEGWLETYWPLWRRHVGGVKYHGLKNAFIAGWKQHRVTSAASRRQRKMLGHR